MALDFAVKNMPIECVASASAKMDLTIGTFPSYNNMFKGIVHPNNSFNTSIDIQPFVYDLVNTSGFDLTTSDTLFSVSSMHNRLRVKMLQGATERLNVSNIHLLNKNLLFSEWERFNNKEPFGEYKQYWDNKGDNDIDWLKWDLKGRFWDDPIPHNFYTYGNIFDLIGGVHSKSRYWKKALKGAPLFLTIFHSHLESSVYKVGLAYYANKKDTSGEFINTSADLPFIAGNYKLYNISKFTSGRDFIGAKVTQPNISGGFERLIWYEMVDPACFKGEAFQLYWINRRGGLDFLPMEGKSYKSNSSRREGFTLDKRRITSSGFTGKASDSLNKNILTTSKRRYDLNSAILDDYEYAGIEDLFYSPSVWLYSDREKRIIPVRVNDTNFDFKTFKNDKAFNFAVQVEDELITNIF